MSGRSRTLASLAALGLAAATAFAQTVEAPIRLTRQVAESIARQNNPRISVARLNALASVQASRVAKSAYYPTLDAYLTGVAAHEGGRISAGGLSNPAIYDRAAGGVALNQLVTDFGRTSNLVETSTLHAQADAERTIATTADIVLAVDESFYGALGAQALLKVAQQTVSARQSVADQVGALAQSKLRSELDASFAQVDLAESKLLLLDAGNAEKAALAVLSAVLGYPDQKNFELVEETTPLAAPAAEVGPLVGEALSHRPEVAALDDEARAAETFHIAEKDLMLPNVRALGAAGGAPWRNENISPWYGAIGINVDIPIFNGFQFQARAAESDFLAQAARQALAELENDVARDVRTAWLDAAAAYERIAVADQLFAQANRALDLARGRYDLGLSSIVELSQAQLQQTRAEIGATEARYRYRVAEARLQYQTGGR
ncbi:MAG TPA: TolC family protein [Thermoanaerobaculia bacterium]|nr:TolC family protein [Thermoanaerobaculia bacterium]